MFLRGLDVLSVLLDRANLHASARGFDAGILASARLAPDMLPFTGQIQRASDTAKCMNNAIVEEIMQGGRR